ncbi:hypothetical protein HW115_13785 [Verrucomicrobiaceae bacterium N1E253]|uniref:Uncharacterized protein n=1 Tax=Oceaniferula marina TaxID=2748318 RepID=A0A851GHL1_9BACT|nr:hypothetical protein [Oceaniferula marina]NWK56689.1 hypothetical protein [Oceaniferula marina]
MSLFRFLAWSLPLAIALVPTASANGKKTPPASITFHVEGTAAEAPKFTRKVETLAGERYFRKVPEVSTNDIIAFSPFPADDKKTYGVVFQLNKQAAQRLHASTNLNQGKLLLGLVNGQAVGVVRIDKPVTDGMLVIWSGIQQHEIKLYDKLAPRIGEDPKVWKKRLKYEEKKKQ